jgi:hypothetical protein
MLPKPQESDPTDPISPLLKYQVFHKVVQGPRKNKANTAKCVAVPPVALVT